MKHAPLAMAMLASVATASAGEIARFEHDEFAGRTFAASGPIDNLANSDDYAADFGNTGFNDRAQSLRIERGYWIEVALGSL